MHCSSNYVTCAGREIHFTEWGSGQRGTVVAWHGLARTGRDMDELAGSLADRYRVVCPDTIGRGYSQWSPDPGNEYRLEFYARIAAELFDPWASCERTGSAPPWAGRSARCARQGCSSRT